MFKLLATTIPKLEGRAERVAEIDKHMTAMSVAAGVSSMAALSKTKAEEAAPAAGSPAGSAKKRSNKKKGRK